MEKVSFIIPCYRSEKTLPAVIDEITAKMEGLSGRYDYDIFLVNDASPDGTADVIRQLCEKNDRIRGISFARNFGQHAALMAGYNVCKGDYVVTIDDDGQTPVILAAWGNTLDVVKLLVDAGADVSIRANDGIHVIYQLILPQQGLRNQNAQTQDNFSIHL